MTFLPPSTNTQYDGKLWAVVPLALAALHGVFSGLAQVVLPDSGIVTLSGLSLAHDGGLQMVAMAAIGGATLIAWGLAVGLVAWRYRSFTALFLLLVSIEKALILLGLAVKPTNNTQAVPGMESAALLLVLCLVGLVGARSAKGANSA